MNENRISLEISDADIAVINQAIQTLSEKLQPILIALNASDKNSLAKMKDKTIPFVEKIVQYTDTNTEFVPTFLDVIEMKKDFTAFIQLNNIMRPLIQITKNLDDTATLCGSEAFQASLAYYNSVKQAAKLNVPNAKTIYEDLSVRFNSQKAAKLKPEPIK